MLQAYNDWAIDEWCGAYPGRFIPLGIVPMWDVDLAVEEVHRIAKKGCRSISFLETPHVAGLPELPLRPLGPDARRRSCDENMVLSLHIGAGFDVIQAPAGGTGRPPHGARLPDQRASPRRTCCSARRCAQFPDLKVALSEGGIGWIPFYFDRIDRHFQNQAWLHDGDDFGGKLPSEVFREHILACYITDPSGLLLRDRIGIDIIAWECDYPHTDTTWPESPEFAWKELQDAGLHRRRDPQDHVGERLPVLRLGPVRAHAEGAGDGRRAARPGHRRRHHPHAARRVEASATRPPASASSSPGRRVPTSSTRAVPRDRWARFSR